jgi:hypothetical protein
MVESQKYKLWTVSCPFKLLTPYSDHVSNSLHVCATSDLGRSFVSMLSFRLLVSDLVK